MDKNCDCYWLDEVDCNIRQLVTGTVQNCVKLAETNDVVTDYVFDNFLKEFREQAKEYIE